MGIKLILSILVTVAYTVKGSSNCGNPAIPPDLSSDMSSDIVGGKDAVPYSWPWTVAMVDKKSDFQFCGGSLISNSWVMSAGHCFADDPTPSKYQIKLGVFNKNKKDEPGEIVSDIAEIHVHPEYNRFRITYDITLLKLKEPVQFTDHISPVCLPEVLGESLPDVGTPTWVVGWGDTQVKSNDSPTLKQVSVPIVSDDKCANDYLRFNQTVMFCAGYDEGGKDSCNGDSGGPLMFQNPANNNTWKQLGIVSWGKGCAEPNYYGVYSKVAAYVDFIQQYVTDL